MEIRTQPAFDAHDAPIGRRPRVLFVDAEPELTRALALTMRREGWLIHRAHSVDEALERADAAPYDVVVCDEDLAGLLEELRTSAPQTARVLLSTHRAIESAVEAVNRSDIYRFLFKPCGAQEIALTIHQALEQRAAERRIAEWIGPKAGDATGLAQEFERTLGSLWMGFQPVLVPGGGVFGYEALVRSDDAEIRTPQQLFAAAVQLGRARELGAWIRSAIAARIPAAPPGATILVNVHPDELLDEALFDPRAPLAAFAERVVLEIGQRSAFAAADRVRPEIERLRALGYRVAIDDLGAGYSGLRNFAALAPDLVKLDMELVRNIDRLPTQCAIADTVVRLCRDLDIRTVAQGIETDDEYATVLELGCDYLQGFLFAEATRDFAAYQRAA